MSRFPPHEHRQLSGHLRRVNLRTDLASLADLIEMAFADVMDAGGRAAIREMRQLSGLGFGLNFISRLNGGGLASNFGYVWVEGGRLVGNASVYRAKWPSKLGSAWVIANVAVYPEYRRQGIARRLMQASMELIRKHGGRYAVLQVDADNQGAQRLYEQLGFVNERAWTIWRRGGFESVPEYAPGGVHISRRRHNEWRAEYALAQRLRPAEQGGLGWMQPLHAGQFYSPLWQRFTDFFNLNAIERLVIHADDAGELAASLWVQPRFGSSTRLRLMVLPEYQGLYDDVLLRTALRRYKRNATVIEHPMDEEATNEVLKRYGFRRRRDLVNMRWDVC